ncbi:MAG: type II toxin-antitoxin system prevent-host-death family antitoxin [Deltaproteobacteria bacterium]|nr:type II toxin-antitoxin system prevent-host-death family antitoxin [Deltaproteobacteria bacterium]
MVVDSISEAKAQLSALVERVLQGEEVIISRAGKPVAVLRAYDASRRPRVAGRLKGKVRIAADFDVLPEDIAEAMGAGRS